MFTREKFPAPLEVDREIYIFNKRTLAYQIAVPDPCRGRQGDIRYFLTVLSRVLVQVRLRPLARQIGIYTNLTTQILNFTQASFRPLARLIGSYTKKIGLGYLKRRQFPAPLEVNKQLYKKPASKIVPFQPRNDKFPAPLEVDRQLYTLQRQLRICKMRCFRPLSRQMGIYTQSFGNSQCKRQLVSGPSRGRQVTIPKTTTSKFAGIQFPAPREVDRQLYKKRK